MNPKFREFLRNGRRSLFELAGSARYSRPGSHDLDRKLAPYLDFKNGIFVEAGANDGLAVSNTYYLERFRGWRGLLVEPIPVLFEQARRRRKASTVMNAALVPFDREGQEVELIYGNLMSMVVGAMGSNDADAAHIARAATHDPASGSYRVSVRGRALSSLIDEAKLGPVDFLSLDVEGFEAPVLRGLDLARHRPRFILVEARFPEEIDAILLGHYDFVAQLTVMDRLYRRKTESSL